MGRHCHYLFPRRIFLSLAEDWRKHVEGMVADERRQFEDGAPICGGDPKISALAFWLSVHQVGHAGCSSRIPHRGFHFFVQTMRYVRRFHYDERDREVSYSDRARLRRLCFSDLDRAFPVATAASRLRWQAGIAGRVSLAHLGCLSSEHGDCILGYDRALLPPRWRGAWHGHVLWDAHDLDLVPPRVTEVAENSA
jgi:hypothetical protein